MSIPADATISELLVAAPAELPSVQSTVASQQATAAALSAAARELAGLNEHAKSRLAANTPIFKLAQDELRDLKRDLDSAHLRLAKLLLVLRQLDPSAVAAAEQAIPAIEIPDE
ncbi:hypothetical protein BC828DRAFT_396382 [Blastocladiella britannica]|nr:hypothetical protein BC828DRAFT_396382 [Blastocladiella britannica]